MILSHYQIKKNIHEHNKHFPIEMDSRPGQIQKIYSSPYLISITVRYPKKTVGIVLGRGRKYEGIWFVKDKIIPSEFRIKDKFLDYLRAHLKGCLVVGISCDSKDRIVAIKYKNKNGEGVFCIFWNGKETYFSTNFKSKNKIENFKSWKGKSDINNFEELYEKAFDDFNEVGRRQLDTEKSKESIELDILNDHEQHLRKQYEKKYTKKKERFLKKKIKNIQSDLDKISRWEKIKKALDEDKIDFGEKEKFTLEGITFKFKDEKKHFSKRSAVYDKLKRLRRAENLLQERLENTKKDLNSVISTFNIKVFPIIQPVWAKKRDSEKSNVKFKEYNIAGVYKFVIGKDAKANDYLRNTWASKNDIWFHIDSERGAHGICKVDRIDKLSLVQLQAIASALMVNSGLSSVEIDLIYSDIKGIKGLKGRSGAVTVKRPRYLRLKFLPSWKEIITEV